MTTKFRYIKDFPTDHPRPEGVTELSDQVFGVVYVVCIVIGLPGNIISYLYFKYSNTVAPQRPSAGYNKDYFNILYRIICLTDCVICSTVLPNALAFFNFRRPRWFEPSYFCAGWGLLWEILPYFSVWLVGVMNISRLIVMLKPMHRLRKDVMVISLVVYFVCLILRSVIPVATGLAKYIYDTTDVFCFEINNVENKYSGMHWKFNTVSRLLQLAFPIIPIIISSIGIVWTLKVLSAKHKTNAFQAKPHIHATVTVLIFTLVYIIFNIPGFLNYILMVLAIADGCVVDCYHTKYGSNLFLMWFSWNFTYVLCVVMNSTINPLIYALRMKSFRVFVMFNVRVVESKCSALLSRGPLDESYCDYKHGQVYNDGVHTHAIVLTSTSPSQRETDV